ncbi:alkyl/aryl-sulfatase [Pseudorhodoferax soli]|uniref:Alkyl sulfatase BDS1-like metallo-beta-lactamase superfamily hydrolase n=1 Tax=Pseudorhodoferax soli TaxID=545864 RepID=A0A368XQV0_9BURK|nr:alkyl sulfatase dimerization domain-containing protein [Pseudorhodoferax soli]RCW70351.1 alkyl sulfatase BDS1-like metallo-beta-lactamase superfamily hydrolase [Pseudorhodoferax soli]
MRPAHPDTLAAHARVRAELDFSDRGDFEDVRRGFIATLPDAHIDADSGGVSWSMKPYGFLAGESPDTVNPSLWRMSQLNAVHGLFEVKEGVYQVRGFSLANVTFIEGDTGVIVVDPLQFTEHARAAIALYRAHRGDRPVVAVVYTHSHRDHYGGVRGVIGPDDVRRGVKVIAPNGFTEESFSESILAGVPMRRRALFQFGWSLEPGAMAHVDSGLGKAVGRGGDGFVAPTLLIREPTERHVVDGVEIVFHLTPGTEAPADMNMHYPGLRVLNLAENACHTMHNLCPLRGAKTRDALAWARYLDQALDAFVPGVDALIVQHHWPVWGSERIAQYVAGQRDMYRYLHDQTLRLMSHGRTPREIAEELMLPSELSRQWFARGYYGAVAHNVHAVYAHYLGPYDGNPANLNPLPPAASAVKYMEYMGGADAVVARARQDYEAGQFRWVVEALNHVVFAEPGHQAARQLSADAMEQMGYQAESATWRNSYLLAARELRSRSAASAPKGVSISPDIVSILPFGSFLEYLGIRVNGPKAQGLKARFDWQLSDASGVDTHRLTLSNGALNHLPGSHGAEADAVVRMSREQLGQLSAGRSALLAALDQQELDVRGNAALFRSFVECLDEFDPMFNIVEP